ncbi:glycosyltransferase family protein [Butyrivibrio sp. AE2005]|uniref:glycosyltransferase family protein n=1 Tax=Butyrivibrio sp. AE2005 TaxID=1496722 RepID=UPI00068FFB03|nr:glycosyltransferase family protein [Butyrivibrio sp. AE2005]
MMFPPTIDITKYQDENGAYTEAGRHEMMDDTEKEYEVFSERYSEDVLSHHEMLCKINSLLVAQTDASYKEICDICESYEYHKLSKIFTDFDRFLSAHIIYQTEKAAGIAENVFSLIDSVNDYVYLKQITFYLFRRIQMDFPEDETYSFYENIININPSIFYILQMLDELRIGNKYAVAEKLSYFYKKSGYANEALLIKSFSEKKYENVPINKQNIIQTGRSYNTPKKICFITCVNNALMYDECCYYIGKLLVPAGFEIETLSISDASGMAEGYNMGQSASNADINVFLHQDVCILNPYFIYEIADIFESDNSVGMVGLVGSPALPPDAVMWHDKRVGNLYSAYPDNLSYDYTPDRSGRAKTSVEAIDGLIMISNKKIPWREDLFDGFDFYDISQCTEYIKSGYKVVVPEQSSPWAAHDDGLMKLGLYNKYRLLYINKYKS